MNSYVTGAMIKTLREKHGLTQSDLAEKIGVTPKAVSKWETGKGLPDISLLEPISKALSVSAAELLAGEAVCNKNRSANMLKTSFYVCPVCGNVIFSTGGILAACCGITLPPLEAEESGGEHKIILEQVEDEYCVTLDHEMSKQHYISFIARQSFDGITVIKLYPESAAQARVKIRGGGYVYAYCNKHGLIKKKL